MRCMKSEQRQERKRIIEEKIGMLKFIHVMGMLSMDSSLVQVQMESIIVELGNVFGKEVDEKGAASILKEERSKRKGFFSQLLGAVFNPILRVEDEMQSIAWSVVSRFDDGKI